MTSDFKTFVIKSPHRQAVEAIAGKIFSRGKSGLHRAACRVTPGESNLEDSAIEKETALKIFKVRVERCGKSAPAVG